VEREYWSIPQTDVGMALLCSPAFDDEYANGVGITANIYDTTGLEPAFYINVQSGEASVVLPDPGVTSDQIIYYYYYTGQPTTYMAHSNLILPGMTVLDRTELYTLGQALDAIHMFFYPVYGGEDFYAMDVEFKFVDWGDGPQLYIKQARPYPGWGG